MISHARSASSRRIRPGTLLATLALAQGLVFSVQPVAVATHSPPCPGYGANGERVLNVYLDTLDNSGDPGEYEERIMDELVYTDQLVDYSAGPQLNQDVRWQCTSGSADVQQISGAVIDQWWGRFWDDSSPSTLPSGIAPATEQAHLATVDWSNRAVAGSTSTWNARVEGGFHPSAAGNHTFHITADGGVKVWISGQLTGCSDEDGVCNRKKLIVDSWQDQGPVEFSRTEYLQFDPNDRRKYHYELEIAYFQDSGGNSLKVEYVPPGGPRQVIPASVTEDDCIPFSEAVSAVYDEVVIDDDVIVLAHVESGTEPSDTCGGSGATSGFIGGLYTNAPVVALSVMPESYIGATAHELWHVVGGPGTSLTAHCDDYSDSDYDLDCKGPEPLDNDGFNDPDEINDAYCHLSILDCGKNNYYSVAAPRGWPNRWYGSNYNTSTSDFLSTTGGAQPYCVGVLVDWGEEGDDTNSNLGGPRAGIATLDGNDSVVGDEGVNRYCLGDGADAVYARAGADVLVGGAGGDTLRGEDGNDRLYDGPGPDTIVGGLGTDDRWYRCPDDTGDTYSGIEVIYESMAYCYPENFQPSDSSISRLRPVGDIE